MPRLAANLSMLYTELPFMQRFAAAASDGFTEVECLFPYAYSMAEIATHLGQHGLQQVLINAPPGGGDDPAAIAAAWERGQRGTACLPGREAEFQAGVKLALRYAAELGCPRIHLMAGLVPAGVALSELHQTYIHNLRWAARLAAGVGCTVLIEPINPLDMPGYFLTQQEVAHAVVEEVGLPNCLVQMDLYHCLRMQEPGSGQESLTQQLQRYLPTGRVGHLQIAGVPGRHEPGADMQSLLKWIDTLGYTGWIGCEYRPRAGTSAGLGWAKPWLKAG